jgi:hypothetical protein
MTAYWEIIKSALIDDDDDDDDDDDHDHNDDDDNDYGDHHCIINHTV